MDYDKPLFFENSKDWRNWLEKNHDKSNGIRLLFFKKRSNKPCIKYAEALEEALCFGWIDSVLKKLDENCFTIKFSQRKKKSVWSKLNKNRAEKLISDGKMSKAGFDKISEAKGNGLWEKAYTNKKLERLPSDLKKALIKNKTSWLNFKNFANSYKNRYIGWVRDAKTIETRKKRISKVVKNSFENKKIDY